jgi:hypothetical protein
MHDSLALARQSPTYVTPDEIAHSVAALHSLATESRISLVRSWRRIARTQALLGRTRTRVRSARTAASDMTAGLGTE